MILGGFTIFIRNWQGALAALGVALCCLGAPLAQAQALIRDAEIEATLDRIANPVLQAAGLSPNSVTIYIVDNPRMNAFVAGGNNIFLHTGLMRRLETVDQLRAVIAHEAGHIAGGHLARRNENIRRAQGTTALGAILAVAAAVAIAPEVGIATGLIGGEASLRGLLAHTRSEEGAADQAAVRYMSAAGADPNAILEVMRLFRGQDIVSERYIDPYVQTHPLWRDRIRYLEERVANTRQIAVQEPGLDYWHARMVAKLQGFLDSPRRTLRDFKSSGEIDTMARAIAYHREPNTKQARSAMASLLRARPQDPYYHELDGQFALERGDVPASVAAYRQAVALAPSEPLILAGLGRALVAADTDIATREALSVLTRARQLDDADARALRDLAVVYARLGDTANASLATAERFLLLGRVQDAGLHARRAMAALPEGSPGWRQAAEIDTIARRTK